MKRIDEYVVIDLEEYEDRKKGIIYSLVEGYEKDDEFKAKWCKEEFGRDNEKKLPKRIRIGTKAKAIEFCVWLYALLTGGKDIEKPF